MSDIFSILRYLKVNAVMHQAFDPGDSGWGAVKGWFDDDDDDDTVETQLPENHCKKCRGKMRLLDTGFKKKIYHCPKCEK